MGDAGHRAELVEIIRQIRNRWRLKLALRGIVVVVAGSLLALLLSASGLEALRFSPAAIISLRIVVALVFAALAGAWLWMPLRRRVSDGQDWEGTGYRSMDPDALRWWLDDQAAKWRDKYGITVSEDS